MFDIGDVGVFLGLDVGKTAQHGHGITPAGKKVFDEQLPNGEPKPQAVLDKLTAKFGTVLVIVDQPASIGALPLTIARDTGSKVAYLRVLAMRRIAHLYLGEAKTDANDAAVIVGAARTMPHRLRSLAVTHEITAELTVLVDVDQDPAAEATRTSNWVRGLLTQFHPSWNAAWVPPGPPAHDLAARTLRLPSRPTQSPAAADSSKSSGPWPRAWPPGSSTTSSTHWTNKTVVAPGTGTLDVMIPSLAAPPPAPNTTDAGPRNDHSPVLLRLVATASACSSLRDGTLYEPTRCRSSCRKTSPGLTKDMTPAQLPIRLPGNRFRPLIQPGSLCAPPPQHTKKAVLA